MENDVFIQNNEWKRTLPILNLPFQVESLIGYLLRLDYINGFTPGTLLKNALPVSEHGHLKK